MDNINYLLDELHNILKAKSKEAKLLLCLREGHEYLLEEIGFRGSKLLWKNDRFYLVEDYHKEPFLWAQWQAEDLEIIEYSSINDLVRCLKNYGKVWSYYSFDLHRRHTLIDEKLRYNRNSKRLKFPEDRMRYLEQKDYGGFWSLLSNSLALISKNTSSSRIFGEMEFEENKQTPPSRAYLKLWEILMKLPYVPSSNQTVMDLGCAPGGWTWVLSKFAKEVISIDKAQMSQNILKIGNVRFEEKSAYSINPKEYLNVQWIFSDVISYPEKTLELIERWISDGYLGNMVFTIKFQGKTNFEVINKLKTIPHSRLTHLYHNKHELTWYRLQNNS